MEQFYQDAMEIVRQTRGISLPQFGSASILEYKSETLTDAVTEIDQKIESFLKTELQKRYPTIAFYGEESGGTNDTKSFWLVDPIDGTGMYVRGIPVCTTLVAHVDNGEVQFGAVYDFVNDIIYHAERGKGAYANGEKLSVRNNDGAERSYIGYDIKAENPNNAELRQFMHTKFGYTKFLCSGYEYILIASGKLDGRIVYDPYGKEYDFAAGSLLVAEAGGVVTNIGSSSYDYKDLNHIAATPVLHKRLTEGPDALFPVVE